MVERVRLRDIEGPPKKGRGRPFPPGNPGRPPGSKNRTTRVVDQLLAGEAEMITRAAIEKAKGGDAGCVKLCLDRLSPRRNGRPVDFEVPFITKPQDCVAAIAAITNGVNDGSLTAEEASDLVRLINAFASAITAYLRRMTGRREKDQSKIVCTCSCETNPTVR
jgi:hypothetical protein